MDDFFRTQSSSPQSPVMVSTSNQAATGLFLRENLSSIVGQGEADCITGDATNSLVSPFISDPDLSSVSQCLDVITDGEEKNASGLHAQVRTVLFCLVTYVTSGMASTSLKETLESETALRLTARLVQFIISDRDIQEFLPMDLANMDCADRISILACIRALASSLFKRHWTGDSLFPKHSILGQTVQFLRWWARLYPQSLDADEEDQHVYEESRLPTPADCHLPQGSLDPVKLAELSLHDRHDKVLLITCYPLFSISDQSLLFRSMCYFKMADATNQARLLEKIANNNIPLATGEILTAFQRLSVLRQGPMQSSALSYLALRVRRDRLLEDAFDQLWRRKAPELALPIRIQIDGEGEVGQDQGGVSQEFFRLAIIEMFNPAYGLFVVDEDTHMAWFNPDCLEPSYKFELFGLLMALAVQNGYTLPVTFPLALYGLILHSHRLVTQDIEDGWPRLVQSLEQLRAYKGDVEADLGVPYTWSTKAFDRVVEVDMTATDHTQWSMRNALAQLDTTAPAAPLVTNETRDAFVIDYVSWQVIFSVRLQITAFLAGFGHCMQPSEQLASLTPRSLRDTVEGHRDIDIDALWEATKYDGYESNDPIVEHFWDILRNDFDDRRRRDLLEFVTASDRVPVTGVATMEFWIQRNGVDSEMIPSASTCFARLLLPEYASREKLKRKLEIALDNVTGFGLR